MNVYEEYIFSDTIMDCLLSVEGHAFCFGFLGKRDNLFFLCCLYHSSIAQLSFFVFDLHLYRRKSNNNRCLQDDIKQYNFIIHYNIAIFCMWQEEAVLD
jgi:hypothetical protein